LQDEREFRNEELAMSEQNRAVSFSPRATTLRIQRLLATPINVVRIEFTGDDVRGLARVGTLALYGPLVLIGYLLLLGGLARLVAMRVGWGWSLFILGGAHVLIGLYGLTAGGHQVPARVYPVVDPEVGEDGVSERLDTLVSSASTSEPISTPPAFPPRTRTSL